MGGKSAMVQSAKRKRRYSTNPATTQDQFSQVKDRALARRDGALWLVETIFHTGGDGSEGGARGLVLIANFYFRPHWRDRRGDGDPVHVADRHRGAEQRVIAADDNPLRRGLGGNDVERL